MNRRLVVRLAAALFAAMLIVVPSQALAGKGGGKKNKPLVVCKHGCKYKTIQDAVDKVKKKNSKIYVLPGKYVEGVIVEGHKYDGLTIAGMKEKTKKKKNGKKKKTYKPANPKKVILEGKNAKLPDGSTANSGIEGANVKKLKLENMWARNYGANGLFVHDTDIGGDNDNGKFDCADYLMKNTITSGNRAYGLYAFGCVGGRMTDSVGYHHGDSAFYVGASPVQSKPKPTKLDHLEAYENVLGYSGTNSRYVTIEKSAFYNNGVGVVPNTLDSEPFEPSADSTIKNNDIFWNNFNYFLPNSGVKTVSDGLGQLGDLTIQYPTGAGVVLLGTTGWTVKNNNIFGNFKWGAAIVSDPFNDGQDATPFDNQFIDNQMGRNGTDTNAVDFFNQGAGSGQCFQGNSSSTFDSSGNPASDALLYPTSCPDNTPDTPAGQTGDAQGNAAQFADLAGYVTTDPPENQECSWTKHSHPKFKNYKPRNVTPGPNCG
jgi:hypothetical protein